MSRIFISAILCFWTFLQVDAQRPDLPRRGGPPNKEMAEKIQVERIAFFSEKIGLTTEEAQLFWPVYNEMDNKRTELFDEKASIVKRFINDGDNVSEKELTELLNRLVTVQQEEAKLPADYDPRFRKILSDKKVMKLYVAEMEFRNYLLQKVRVIRRERVKTE